jgi:hypothetical protein
MKSNDKATPEIIHATGKKNHGEYASNTPLNKSKPNAPPS